MRILILTDLHANLCALEAVLKHTEHEGIDVILSMGDQVNYGPWPAETLALLRQRRAILMLGNHEARLRSLILNEDGPLKDGYNWSLLRWTQSRLPGEEFIYPDCLRYRNVLFTHAMPGDLFRLMEPDDMEGFAQIAACLPKNVDTVISGHNHSPWQVRVNGKTFLNPGSTGVFEGGKGFTAAYLILDDREGDIRLEAYELPYDPSGIKEAFMRSGAAEAAPEFARLVMESLETGSTKAFADFILMARAMGGQAGLDWTSRECFRLAAESYSWKDGLSMERYWR